MRKNQKKKSKAAVPPIPPLSPKALDDVQRIERYARHALSDCRNIGGDFNTEKAERILRTCAVQVLNTQLAYYESLPGFHEEWIIDLQDNSIEFAVKMIPGGYSDALYEHFRDLLWETTLADLNKPTTPSITEGKSQSPETSIASQIEDLRIECRLTVEDIAEALSVSPRSVYRHLSQGAIPRARQIAAYEKLFSEKLGKSIRLETSGKRQ